MAEKQKSLSSFDYTKDINIKAKEYFGIGGTGNLYNITLSKALNFNEGDRYNFDLDLDKGRFTISKNGTLHAYNNNLKGKQVRPCLGIYYKTNTIVNLEK